MAVQLPEEDRIRYCDDDLELRFMQQHLALRSSIVSVGTLELSRHIPFYILPLLDISQWSVTKLSTCLPEMIFQKMALFCCCYPGSEAVVFIMMSTQTAVFNLTDTILRALNKKKFVVGIFGGELVRG
jgi:hypothetical protein